MDRLLNSKEFQAVLLQVDKVMIQIQEKTENVLGRCAALEAMMVDYMEANPKVDDQWTEERLRALEMKVKGLKIEPRGN